MKEVECFTILLLCLHCYVMFFHCVLLYRTREHLAVTSVNALIALPATKLGVVLKDLSASA